MQGTLFSYTAIITPLRLANRDHGPLLLNLVGLHRCVPIYTFDLSSSSIDSLIKQ
jgi:hypothetical protein